MVAGGRDIHTSIQDFPHGGSRHAFAACAVFHVREHKVHPSLAAPARDETGHRLATRASHDVANKENAQKIAHGRPPGNEIVPPSRTLAVAMPEGASSFLHDRISVREKMTFSIIRRSRLGRKIQRRKNKPWRAAGRFLQAFHSPSEKTLLDQSRRAFTPQRPSTKSALRTLLTISLRNPPPPSECHARALTSRKGVTQSRRTTSGAQRCAIPEYAQWRSTAPPRRGRTVSASLLHRLP